MQIEIWIGDKNNIDINGSIEMDNQERIKFEELINSLFNPVEFEETDQFRSWRMAQENRIQYPHLWSPKEYEVLLNCKSIEDGVSNLGRSGMSVIIRSGDWVSKYYSWCEKNKKEVKEWNNLENIRQFLKEHENEIKRKYKSRSAKNCLEKNNKKIEELRNKIEDLKKRAEKFALTSIAVEARTQIKEFELRKKALDDENLSLKGI